MFFHNCLNLHTLLSKKKESIFFLTDFKSILDRHENYAFVELQYEYLQIGNIS